MLEIINMQNLKLTMSWTNLIWRAQVPKILACSYLVIYFDVFRGRSTGCSSSLSWVSIGSLVNSSFLFSKSSFAPHVHQSIHRPIIQLIHSALSSITCICTDTKKGHKTKKFVHQSRPLVAHPRTYITTLYSMRNHSMKIYKLQNSGL